MKKYKLTKYAPASLMELLSLSIPMMLSVLSQNLMVLTDRLILANYSITAMNSVAAASIVSFAFIIIGISIAGISEVFVGQYNGSKQYDKAAIPVWQMIWFGLGLSILFVPVAMFSSEYLIPKTLQQEGLAYFKILMYFASIMPITSAISGFFVGIGRTKIITMAVLISNLINLILAIMLVFGIDGVIPSLGTTGAAIATLIAELIQFIILLAIFLNKKNRQKYKTFNFKFNKSIFLNCFKYGYPAAIGHATEMAAWSTLFHIAATASTLHVTILTMGQNIFLLFVFMTEGMQKGVTSVASNLIGARMLNLITKLLISSLKMHFTIVAMLAIPLIFYPEYVIQLFDLDHNIRNVEPGFVMAATSAFRFVWIYFIFDGLVWVIAGILTSAGDTKFIMITNTLCSWVLGVVPFYIFMSTIGVNSKYIWANNCLYAIVNLALFIIRLKSGKWKKLIL